MDKYGFLWTGSGPFQYSSTSGTYSVLRFDTSITMANDASKTIFAVAVTDAANVRDLWDALPFSRVFTAIFGRAFLHHDSLIFPRVPVLAISYACNLHPGKGTRVL